MEPRLIIGWCSSFAPNGMTGPPNCSSNRRSCGGFPFHSFCWLPFIESRLQSLLFLQFHFVSSRWSADSRWFHRRSSPSFPKSNELLVCITLVFLMVRENSATFFASFLFCMNNFESTGWPNLERQFAYYWPRCLWRSTICRTFPS